MQYSTDLPYSNSVASATSRRRTTQSTHHQANPGIGNGSRTMVCIRSNQSPFKSFACQRNPKTKSMLVFFFSFFHYSQAIAQYEYDIKKKNIINFDKAGFRIGCPRGQQLLVPTDIQEVSTTDRANGNNHLVELRAVLLR